MGVGVALVEPQYHVNVGHVARLMKNFGLPQLYLIKPAFDQEEAKRYSMHGADVLASAKVVTLAQLRKKFDVLVGTTAIRATSRLNILREPVSPEQLAGIVCESEGRDFCIVLGRESSGLNNKELGMCDLVATIDTKTDYKTLNIAHALAILLYQISKSKPEAPAKKSRRKIDVASQDDIGLLMQYIDKVAKASNYDSHKQPMLNSAVKRIFVKSVPTAKDVMLVVSLLRRSLLAIERKQK